MQLVVDFDEKNLPLQAPERLQARHGLGKVYYNLHQFRKAIEVLEDVVQTRRKTFLPTDHDLLASQYELACAYSRDNQGEKSLSVYSKR